MESLWEVPQPKTLGPCGPNAFGLGTSLGTPFTPSAFPNNVLIYSRSQLHITNCLLYPAHCCILVYCTQPTVHFTQYNAQCSLYSAVYLLTVYTVQFTIIQYTQCSLPGLDLVAPARHRTQSRLLLCTVLN